MTLGTIRQAAMAGTMLAASGMAMADFAPLAVGNRWTYEGTLVIQGSFGDEYRSGESLNLEVTSQRRSGDTLIHSIRMRDSLYSRQRKTSSAPAADLPDTLLVQTWKFGSVGDEVFRYAQPDSGILPETGQLSFPGKPFSVFGSSLLFAAHRNLPGDPVAVPGGPAGLVRTANSSAGTYWQDWFLDGVGAVWENTFLSAGASCGPTLRRDLYLRKFNGQPVSIGIDPPPPALAKEAKPSCSLRYRKGGRVGIASPIPGIVVDLAGRALARE